MLEYIWRQFVSSQLSSIGHFHDDVILLRTSFDRRKQFVFTWLLLECYFHYH